MEELKDNPHGIGIFDWLNSTYQLLLLVRRDTGMLVQIGRDVAAIKAAQTSMQADITIIKNATANGPPPPSGDVAAFNPTMDSIEKQ